MRASTFLFYIMKFLFSTSLLLTTVLALPHSHSPDATTSALFSVVAPSPISNATTSALFSVVGTPPASSVPSSAVKAASSSGIGAATASAVPSAKPANATQAQHTHGDDETPANNHQVNDHEHDYNDDDRKNNTPLPSAMDVKPAGSNASIPLNTTTPSAKPMTGSPPSQKEPPPQQKMGATALNSTTPSGKPVTTPSPSGKPTPSNLPQPQQQQLLQQNLGAIAPYLNATLTSAFDNNGYSDSEDDEKAFLANKVASYSKEGGEGDKTASPTGVGAVSKPVKETKSAGVKDAGAMDAGKVGKGKSTADLIPDSRVEA